MLSLFKFLKREPKPFAEGHLDVGHGHRVYYAEYGNPQGEPVICFHGGPGAWSKPKHVKVFDLKRWRVILFDQRGCGKSQFKDALKANTTSHLLADARALLKHLAISKVTVFGGSWGSTLALLFAQAHPHMVTRLIVNKVFLARQKDVRWLTHESAIFYPDLMDRLLAMCGTADKMVPYFYRLAMSKKRGDLQKSFRLFGGYEGALSTLDPAEAEEYPANAENMRHYQIYIQYTQDNFYLKEDQIMKNIGKIKHIPMLILHNRLDLVCPVEQAWVLHKALPKSRLEIVADFGHTTNKLNAATKAAIEKMLR